MVLATFLLGGGRAGRNGMKNRITETIELTISYSTDHEDDRIGLLDLHDVLSEGAASYLPFKHTNAAWGIARTSVAYSGKETEDA